MWFITRPMAFSLPGISRAEKHDDVARAEIHVLVIVDRDPGQRRQRLALRAGAQAQHVLRRVVAHVRVADLQPRRHLEVPQPGRDLRVLDHATPDERHLPPVLLGQVHEHLHPVQARREQRDDDLPLGRGEDLLERVDDLQLRAGVARPVDVRAVAEERQHAPRAQLGEPVEIHVLAVERRLVDLEVPGVHDRAGRRVDRQRHAVRHAVRHADELDLERPDRDGLARLHRHQPPARLGIELRLEKRQRQRRAVHRPVHVRQHVGHGADVVLVPVRQHEGLHTPRVLLQVREVRDDQVHARQVGFREHHPGVHHDGRVAAGEDHHVHAELAEAAERHDLEISQRHPSLNESKAARTTPSA